MVTEADHVNRWLKSQWNVTVPDDWLQACIEWIQEENQGQTLSLSEINSSVYEQWLLCDLQEIGAGCLPADLVQQQKFMLTGSYCLQVNSVLDASSSYYSQLQKLTGSENENVHVSATQATQFTQTQSFAKESSNRMLMMQMTDGCQEIQAMEYQPIPCLSVNLLPGTKVVVSGSVLCRLGVLMLKKNNIRVLGGEVEALAEEHAQENLLKQQLGQNELLTQNPPERQRREFDTSANQKPQHRKPAGNSNQSVIRTHQPVQNNQSSVGIGQNNQSMRNTANQHQADFEEEDFLDGVDPADLEAMEQQWDDDVDYEMLMTEIDFSDGSAQSKKTGKAAPQSGSAAPSKPRNTASHPSHATTHTASANRQDGQGSGRHPSNLSSSFVGAFDDDDDDFDFDVPSRSQVMSPPWKPGNSATSVNSRQQGSNTSTHGSTTGFKKEQSPVQSNASHSKPWPVNPTLPSASNPIPSMSNQRNTNKRIKLEGARESSYAFSPQHRQLNLPARALKESPQNVVKPFQADPSERSTLQQKPRQPKTDLSREQFVYLKDVLEEDQKQVSRIIRVKAYISTLLSKLEHNKGTQWSLMVKINDGTASLDVELGNQMLANLIGFTAPECMDMKNRAKQDKSLKKKMIDGIGQCQRSLVQLSCILEVEFSPSKPHPVVLGYRDVIQADLEALQQRLVTFNLH